ncbi:MAG: general secretion pathway protein GspK [Xanthomonadales bacterium]|nr:general secretion pathway protein GspK [Xanthomonadales bacterium]
MSRRRPSPRKPGARASRGVAFVLVMWVIALLSILLGSFAVIARTEGMQSRHLFDTTTARYAAEAGLNLAVYGLSKPNPEEKWMADGRSYTFTFDGAEVEISITDDSGKIDINSADLVTLKNLFVGAGVDEIRAEELADAIQDWRDPDDLVSPHGAEVDDYEAVDLPYGPRNAPFETLSELQQVFGMDYETYMKVEPAITMYSGRGTPSAAYAPLEALMAIPGMTPEYAQQIIDGRQQLPAGALNQGTSGLVLPDGTPVMADGGGLTYSVKSRATLPNGASTVLDATIRMGGMNSAGRPYVVLRWRDGETA